MKDIEIHRYAIKSMMAPEDYDAESVLNFDSVDELTKQFYETDDFQNRSQWRDKVGESFDNERISKFKAYYKDICDLWEYLDDTIQRNESFNPDKVYFLHHREDLFSLREQIEKLDEDVSAVYNEFCR